MNFAAPSPFILVLSLVLTLLGASRAQAYCVAHECSLDAPGGDSCVRDVETGCSTEGVALVRPNGCIQFAVQQGAGATLGISDADFEAAIAAAFETWAEADCGDGDPPSIEVRSVGSVPVDEPFSCLAVPAVNVDTWFMSDQLAGEDAITANSGATAGLTRPSFFVEDGEVFDADVLLNELWFLVQREENIGDFLHVVAMHEAGHALGLAHSHDEGALMHRDYRVTKDRTLTQDDIDGVCALFPPMSLDCDAPSKLPAAFGEDACEAEHERREDEEMMDPAPPAEDSGCAVSAVHGSDRSALGCVGCTLLLLTWTARRRARTLLATALLVAGSIGCASPASAPSTGESQAPNSPAARAAAIEPDGELLARITALEGACEHVPATGKLSCQGHADEELALEYLTGKRSRLGELPTLIRVLWEGYPKRRAIGAQILSIGFSVKLGDNLTEGAVDAGLASLLIEALTALPVVEARKITPAAVHAAMLAGKAHALLAALTANADAELRYVGYRRLMVHGRLRALAPIKAAAFGPDAQLAAAAIDGARNMPDWTDEEQGALCPWILELIEHPDAARWARAAQVLRNCSGTHVDALLASFRALHASSKLDNARLAALTNVCKKSENLASGRCASTLALLETLLDDRRSESRLRLAALTAIVSQSLGDADEIDPRLPDPSLLPRLLKKHQDDPDTEIARYAQRMRAHLAFVASNARAEKKPER